MFKTLRKLAEAATPGPWYMTEKDSVFGTTFLVCDNEENSNFEFVKAANPQTILKLLDVVEASYEVIAYAKLLNEHIEALDKALEALDE